MYKVTNGLSPEIISEIFQITEQSRYNLRYNSTYSVFIVVENQSLSWALKYGSLFHPLSSRLILSQDIKKHLRNGSLVTVPADFARPIYHKLVSYRINFEKEKSFQTA